MSENEATIPRKLWELPVRLTATDIRRIAEAGRQMARIAAQSDAKGEIQIPLDHYPEWDPQSEADEEARRSDDPGASLSLYTSFGDMSFVLANDGKRELATMTPDEFGAFVRAFEAVEAVLDVQERQNSTSAVPLPPPT